MAIRYIPYQQVDKGKWDACINRAHNGLIYASSTYLDAMAKNWDALVLNDYEAVMPLTWNKKYGLHYLYQPAFTASLGVFGQSVDANMVNEFLHAVPAKFKYWDISLNAGNFFELKDFNLYERINLILDLNRSYDELWNGYRDNIKRNVKKSRQLQLTVNRNIAVADVVQVAKQQSARFSSLRDEDYDRFEKLYQHLYEKEKATTYGVYQGKQLIASAVFFYYGQRACYILAGNHPNGKTLGASHALIDAFIKDHAGNRLLLDFEGSDVSSLAFFYSSFGAVAEKYPAIRLNRLPAPLKWFKK